jgi:hypothetical protein
MALFTTHAAKSLGCDARRQRKDGTFVWKTVGQKTATTGGFATFGERHHHYDFNF